MYTSVGCAGEEKPLIGLSPAEARELLAAGTAAVGVPLEDRDAVIEHLLAVELRDKGGFERLLALDGLLGRDGSVAGRGLEPIAVRHEDGAIVSVDGGNHVGHAVAAFATRVALERAAEHGLALVAADRHKWSGSLGYYAETAAEAGFVAIVAASGGVLVAPVGGREAALSANPLAFGFPTAGEPLVWDATTAAISGVALGACRRDGTPLPEAVALDRDGSPTTDPEAAAAGAILAWGGHRGSGLSLSVQLLTLLSGMSAQQRGGAGWGFLVVAVDPGRFLPLETYRRRVTELAEAIRSSRPGPGFARVRVPSEGSHEAKRRRSEAGITVPEHVYRRVVELVGRPR